MRGWVLIGGKQVPILRTKSDGLRTQNAATNAVTHVHRTPAPPEAGPETDPDTQPDPNVPGGPSHPFAWGKTAHKPHNLYKRIVVPTLVSAGQQAKDGHWVEIDGHPVFLDGGADDAGGGGSAAEHDHGGGAAPEAMDDFVKRLEGEHPGTKIDITQARDGHIAVSRIVVPEGERNQGTGSAIMREVIKKADAEGRVVSLTPSGDYGGSVPKLKKWYRSLGFVDNTGRNADYAISDSMIRQPTPAAKALGLKAAHAHTFADHPDLEPAPAPTNDYAQSQHLHQPLNLGDPGTEPVQGGLGGLLETQPPTGPRIGVTDPEEPEEGTTQTKDGHWVEIDGHPVFLDGGADDSGGGRGGGAVEHQHGTPADAPTVGGEQLVSEMADDVAGLTDAERSAIGAYSSTDGFTINEALRDGKTPPQRVGGSTVLKNLDSALAGASVPRSITVFRGLPASVVDGAKVGDVLHDDAYGSTAPELELAKQAADFHVDGKSAIMHIEVPRGSPGLAFDVSEMDPDAEETGGPYELLLARGANYTVTGVDADGTVHAKVSW